MALMHYPLDEYLILDEMRSEFRLQYVEGDVLAMSGSSFDKSRITNNLLRLLQALPPEYRFYFSRVRLATPSGLYSYPDFMVVRDPIEMVPSIRDTVTNPVMLIEIPSKWTDEFDRGKKFEHYSTIPTLRDVLYIDQYKIGVEHRSRDGGVWRTKSFGEGERLVITPIAVPVDALYEDVTIPA
jgi:Uma2 family endonuclease